MDYYYYDQAEASEDYEYDDHMIQPEEETFKDVCQGCIKSSTQQVQKYIIVLLGCGFLQRVAWELIRISVDNKHQYLYNLISLICGLVSLWFYVGVRSSIYVFLHIMHLSLFLKVVFKFKRKYTGPLLCIYTIVCLLFLEYILTSEQYETIRGTQMVVSMKLISLAFEVQDAMENYQLLTCWGYLLSPSSLILGPWISLKDYKPNFNEKFRFKSQLVRILLNIFLAVIFLNLSNCILPWLKQFAGAGPWWGTYLDAFSVRCSHYFVCYLSRATLMTTQTNSLSSANAIVKPLAIEFPRSMSDVIRNWNIPMHLWLKLNIFNRLRASKYPYFMAILITYLVSCLVHGFNFKVHLVLLSLAGFSYFENLLRRCLAQIFDACIESSGCKENCKYLYCGRTSGQGFSKASLLVCLVNFVFSLLVVIQLAYLGVMLTGVTDNVVNILQIWSDMNYFGHILALIMFAFYKCI